MTTYAVTAATGHLGRLAIDALLERVPASEVVAIVRDAGKAQEIAARGVDVRLAAYDQPEALHAALEGVDRLLLISGSEVGQRVQQHRNVIDAAKAGGTARVVYTSAPHATTSALVLAPEHKATEEYLTSSGLAYTIVRNNWYTENYVRDVQQAAQTGEIVGAYGEGRVASATRADLAEGAVVALLGDEHAGKVYEFSGEYAWSFPELAAAASAILGKPVVYRDVDGATLVEELTSAGVPEEAAGFFAAIAANISDGLLADATRDLATLLGRPTTPLEQGLRAAFTS